MILSKRCLHGLRAVLYLSLHAKKEGFHSIREISNELNIPFHFLTKVLQDLTREGVLSSSRGNTGGVRLAKPLDNLNILHIIDLLEGPEFIRGCVLGFSVCSNENPCALHEKWSEIREAMIDMLTSESLEMIADRIESEHLRSQDL